MRAGSERNEKTVVLLVGESDGNNHPVCVCAVIQESWRILSEVNSPLLPVGTETNHRRQTPAPRAEEGLKHATMTSLLYSQLRRKNTV